MLDMDSRNNLELILTCGSTVGKHARAQHSSANVYLSDSVTIWEAQQWPARQPRRSRLRSLTSSPHLFDRPHVKITHTIMQPNAIIPKHVHEQDYTIYPLTDLDVKRVYHKGDKVTKTVHVQMKKGQHYVAKK